MRFGLLAILVACVFTCGRQAAAQAVGETMQINRQSMQGVGNASGQAIQLNPLAAQPTVPGQTAVQDADAQRLLPDCGCARQPIFSTHAGEVVPGTQIILTSPAHDAVIFYTTDGWTPTEASARYTGPISINSDTRLQAIAVEPQKLPSPIAEVSYTVSGSPAPKPQRALANDGVLLKGTPLRLVTGAEVTSDTAQVGDHVPLLLDENVMVGETIVVPRGTPVEAVLTRVERAGRAGKPGVLAFQVKSLDAHGTPVPLSANLTLAAPNLAVQNQKIADASLVHIASAPPPGEEADIEPGMALTASVSADTVVNR